MFSHSKLQGECSEAVFVVECLRRGLAVAHPYGDSCRYDLLVDCGGRISRVQVKSVSRRSPDGAYHLAVMRSVCSRKKAYSRGDFDLLAAYLIPCDTWYIIPVAAVADIKTIAIHPGRARRRLERYRNAWDLLRKKGLSSRA